MNSFGAWIARWIPPRLLGIYRRMAYAGSARHCPVCGGEFRLFLPAGIAARPDACCPACGALERHRLAWLFFTRYTELFRRRIRMLHFAPEPCLSRRLAAAPGIDYLSVDLVAGHAMEAMDITDIRYPDASFEVIYCSHVLEHVPNDRRAMEELRRVLRPDGWALFQVPIEGQRTYEDWSLTTERERFEAFGQHDHVRVYGLDIHQRLEEAGFTVRTVDLCGDLAEEEVSRYGLDRTEPMFFCTRSAPHRA